MDDDRSTANWTITLNQSIGDISADDWDRCAGTDNPLQSHALLKAMEDSASAIAETGWIPRHLTLMDSNGRITGVVVLCQNLSCG